MDQLKGKTVFMILYNYFNNDYSIIKIMENLEDAYDYICLQELNNNRIIEPFHNSTKIIAISKSGDIEKKCVDKFLNICFISSGKYNKFNLCNYCSVSNYAIIPMEIC